MFALIYDAVHFSDMILLLYTMSEKRVYGFFNIFLSNLNFLFS